MLKANKVSFKLMRKQDKSKPKSLQTNIKLKQ